MHCCVSEKGSYNKFYGLLTSRLCKFEPQNYKYSFKYTLWDYLKALGKYEIRQIANLAKLYSDLIFSGDTPLHFMKVLSFEELTKPQILFLFVILDDLFERSSIDQLKQIFKRGVQDKHEEFRKGLS
jgi:hypothetical protein